MMCHAAVAREHQLPRPCIDPEIRGLHQRRLERTLSKLGLSQTESRHFFRVEERTCAKICRKFRSKSANEGCNGSFHDKESTVCSCATSFQMTFDYEKIMEQLLDMLSQRLQKRMVLTYRRLRQIRKKYGHFIVSAQKSCKHKKLKRSLVRFYKLLYKHGVAPQDSAISGATLDKLEMWLAKYVQACSGQANQDQQNGAQV